MIKINGLEIDGRSLSCYALVEETPKKESSSTNTEFLKSLEQDHQVSSSSDEEYDTSYDFTDVYSTDKDLKRKAENSPIMQDAMTKVVGKNSRKKQRSAILKIKPKL